MSLTSIYPTKWDTWLTQAIDFLTSDASLSDNRLSWRMLEDMPFENSKELECTHLSSDPDPLWTMLCILNWQSLHIGCPLWQWSIVEIEFKFSTEKGLSKDSKDFLARIKDRNTEGGECCGVKVDEYVYLLADPNCFGGCFLFIMCMFDDSLLLLKIQ